MPIDDESAVADGVALTCSVCGKEYSGSKTLMCPSCQAKVEKDAASFAKKLDEAIVADQKKGYPLDTCVISGKKLGSMGDAVVFVEGDQEVQLCCKSCRKVSKVTPRRDARRPTPPRSPALAHCPRTHSLHGVGARPARAGRGADVAA